MNATNGTVSKPRPSFIKRSSSGYSSMMSQSLSQSLAGSSATEGMFSVLNEN